MTFKRLAEQLNSNFTKLATNNCLYHTDIDKDILWNTYLLNIPISEKQINNCNTCKSFIKNYGNLVLINEDYTLTSIWNKELVDVEVYYQDVFKALDQLVTSTVINNIFLSKDKKLGLSKNYATPSILWHHLHTELPVSSKSYLKAGDIPHIQSEARSSRYVLERSLEDISKEAIEDTLELIESNSLYRGEQFKELVHNFYNLKLSYIECGPSLRNNFYWKYSFDSNAISRIRNGAIGTLLLNLSKGMNIEKAVSAFEYVMAPSNYKRPKPIFTKSSLAKAKETIEQLGFTNSLERRLATQDDLSISNLLFIDKSYIEVNDIFEDLSKDIVQDPKKFSKAEQINIDTFIKDILPNCTSIEVLLEERFNNNLVSLITAENKDSPNLFKWNNNFSWCYSGALADSIKERVKKAGGKVEGLLRVSLSWFNYDDLDLSVVEPNNFVIYYSSNYSRITKGQLDLDMNVNSESREAVENIIYPHTANMLEGEYKIIVNNYNARETIDTGFIVEVAFDNKNYNFKYDSLVRHKERMEVASVFYSKKEGFSIKEILPLSSKISSKKLWNLNTNLFHKVNTIMLSPNYWDSSIGNKHYFFLLEGCNIEGADLKTIRPFFNEFLKEDLLTHKRVFEALGNKLEVKEPKGNSLHGLGFSSTIENHFICRIKKEGKNRVLKVSID